MKEIILELNGLDLFFLVVALASIVLNVVQYIKSQESFRPLKSNLTALFNDVKAKTLLAQQVQNALFAEHNPHESIETLRWEYAQFCQFMIAAFIGLQESVVGILVSVDPRDREGKEAFSAANYGLTPDERAFRERSMANFEKKYFTDRAAEQTEQAKPQAQPSDD